MQKEEETNAKAASRAKAKRRIQDINVWLQCFGLYVSMLAIQSPQYVPELMAYMVSILWASQEYEGSAWTTYDAAYRHQASATGNKQWSKVNPSLYTVCFTGKARKADQRHTGRVLNRVQLPTPCLQVCKAQHVINSGAPRGCPCLHRRRVC